MFSTERIPVHVAKGPVDTTKLHLINQNLHKQLGPIYAQSLGPDVSVIWIADPRYVIFFKNSLMQMYNWKQ